MFNDIGLGFILNLATIILKIPITIVGSRAIEVSKCFAELGDVDTRMKSKHHLSNINHKYYLMLL